MSLLMTTNLVKRSVPGGYAKGKWARRWDDAEDILFKGSAQPASGKTMELLPEGKRSSETILVFAPIGMGFTPADSEKQVCGDLIIWEGRCYEVQAARKWKTDLCPMLDHWELVATREKEGER